MTEDVITVKDAAVLCGVTGAAVYLWIKKGIVKSVMNPDWDGTKKTAKLMVIRSSLPKKNLPAVVPNMENGGNRKILTFMNMTLRDLFGLYAATTIREASKPKTYYTPSEANKLLGIPSEVARFACKMNLVDHSMGKTGRYGRSYQISERGFQQLQQFRAEGKF